MRNRLEGKVAIVTGGLSGIGDAIARRLLEEGARVIAADLSANTERLSGQDIDPVRTDVSDPEQVRDLVAQVMDRHGRLDCLVNSAGTGTERDFLDTPVELFDLSLIHI